MHEGCSHPSPMLATMKSGVPSARMHTYVCTAETTAASQRSANMAGPMHSTLAAAIATPPSSAPHSAVLISSFTCEEGRPAVRPTAGEAPP